MTATRHWPNGGPRRSSIDQAQLRELLGEAELRELLDADALAEIERQLQNLDPEQHARSVDAVHDCCSGSAI